MSISRAIELAPLQYRAPLIQVIEEFKIPNVTEFLGTVYYESDYLKNLVENLNYSTDALLKKFSRKRISYEEVMRYGRCPQHPAYQEAIANCIYGGDFGRKELGNYIEGDGWHYRGQGPIQLTGRANWEAFGEFIGRSDIGQNPFIALRDPLITCQTSGWFWTQYKKLHTHGDNMRSITKKVTGAADTAIRTRTAYRDRVRDLIQTA